MRTGAPLFAVLALVALPLLAIGCAQMKSTDPHAPAARSDAPPTFADDVAFMKQHTDVIVLGDGDARVAIAPAYQGRVMTSTARGESAEGYGWINRALIAAGGGQPHINPWGGEDRFWVGPEGGQFAIFFKKDDPFDLAHWQTPAFIDTDTYAVAERTERSVTFRHHASVTNYSGVQLDMDIERVIRVMHPTDVTLALGMTPGPGVKFVAFESDNKLINAGRQAWTKATGLLSVWILGMFKPSPEAVVVVPYHKGPEDARGPIVNDTYFGKVPADRLSIEDGIILFRGDGQYRTKIGVGPHRATPFCGSWDAERGVLTIVQFNLPYGMTDYVNSMWELQDDPYGGDVINSYNDGPPEPGKKPLGPFYELETSSPAAELMPGQWIAHINRTMHFEGPRDELDALAKRALGVGLERIEGFARR
ncbi:MAG: DUF6786 family protein [Phycisphaerae bacterium]